MENDELGYFVAGLKSVIKRSWPTQQDFAKGVTSRVNLSNVLRKQSGTTLDMREKLAERAGMSVDDIIALGKGKPRTRSTDTPARARFDTRDLDTLSPMDLFERASQYTLDYIDSTMHGANAIAVALKALTYERNRLVELLEQERSIINSVNVAVKVVDQDLNVVYTNRAYVEIFGIALGGKCDTSQCSGCGGECIAAKVIGTGKIAHSRVVNGNDIYVLAGYPILSQSGKVCRVVIMSWPVSELVGMLQDIGFKCLPGEVQDVSVPA